MLVFGKRHSALKACKRQLKGLGMNEISLGKQLLIIPREAAKALAISERTLWQLTKDGVIPCVRIGRSVRYDLRDLQAWIDRHKRPALAGASDSA
jgi:excisionase family DNA binding protein